MIARAMLYHPVLQYMSFFLLFYEYSNLEENYDGIRRKSHVSWLLMDLESYNWYQLIAMTMFDETHEKLSLGCKVAQVSSRGIHIISFDEAILNQRNKMSKYLPICEHQSYLYVFVSLFLLRSTTAN